MTLHEAPFNEDAEQRPLGEANTVVTAAYHSQAPEGASPQRGKAAACSAAASEWRTPSHASPQPLTPSNGSGTVFVFLSYEPLAFRLYLGAFK